MKKYIRALITRDDDFGYVCIPKPIFNELKGKISQFEIQHNEEDGTLLLIPLK